MFADKTGWWIAYDTESTDHDAILVPEELLKDSGNVIKSTKQAQKLLEKLLDWEWDVDYFCASVNHFGYNSKED